MAGGTTVARTEHFALHRAGFQPAGQVSSSAGPGSERSATGGGLSEKPPGPGLEGRPREMPSGSGFEGSATGGRPLEKPSGPGPEGSTALFAVQEEPWIGAIVPKRWARRAVTRNAIKRQIYTVSQDFEARLPAAAHVVRLRAGFDKARFRSATSPELKEAVRAELQRLFAGARP